MEEDFYASIKLVTGEEIFAKVMPCVEEKNINLLLSNPVTVVEVSSRNGSTGYKIEPWLKTTTEDIFILNMEKVITMCENNDIEIIQMHQSFVRKFNNAKSRKPNITRRMGYINSIEEAKEVLEKIYKHL